MADVYQWGFVVHVVPDAPRGINQGSPPPPTELVSTAVTKRLADNFHYPEFDALARLIRAAEDRTHDPTLADRCVKAGQNGVVNLRSDPWHQVFPKWSEVQASSLVKVEHVFASASWKLIDMRTNEATQGDFGISVETGVTTTDTETNTFKETIGLSVKAEWGVVSATMSAEFSAEQQHSRSVSVTKKETISNSFRFGPNATYQTWQLVMTLRAGDKDHGPALEQGVQNYQCLSYPHRAGLSDSELEELGSNLSVAFESLNAAKGDA